MSMPTVILAGGLATRLRPLTERVPKSLIEVAGRPFLEHQLLLLRNRGIRHAILCTGFLGEMIQERFGDGSRLGIHLQYSMDGPRPLGTAGAIRQAIPLLPERFFVLYGDSYLTCDYAAVEAAFLSAARPALMTVFRNEGRYDTSNIHFSGGEIQRYDKRSPTARMRHIDYGLGVFERTVFDAIPAGKPLDLASVYQDLLRSGSLAAFEVPERFHEIGSHEGLREMEQFLSAPVPPEDMLT